MSVADERTGLTVVDRGPSALSGTPASMAGVPARCDGTVRVLLPGPRGEVNGLLLEDGTTIRIDTLGASQISPVCRPGAFVAAEGMRTPRPTAR